MHDVVKIGRVVETLPDEFQDILAQASAEGVRGASEAPGPFWESVGFAPSDREGATHVARL